MPAQWTGELIGEIHNADLTIKNVAQEAGYHPKYVSQVLNGKVDSPNMEKRLRDALARLKEEGQHDPGRD